MNDHLSKRDQFILAVKISLDDARKDLIRTHKHVVFTMEDILQHRAQLIIKQADILLEASEQKTTK